MTRFQEMTFRKPMIWKVRWIQGNGKFRKPMILNSRKFGKGMILKVHEGAGAILGRELQEYHHHYNYHLRFHQNHYHQHCCNIVIMIITMMIMIMMMIIIILKVHEEVNSGKGLHDTPGNSRQPLGMKMIIFIICIFKPVT